ncbi:DNA-binding MarR family transcriptional regulator [Neobacillus niacini]|uniref:MarR family winged helix-turn-helix transcriptional regulator n=1 Tax=Neobacillus niacini TaxID=86668 RepID=UPI00285473D8|nr:MarR family transcriptional regulator [Neobacillus niacini]MDR7077627.1 DNA-binding MarR family transcriptional regulator [Neobacillus niacini]
MDKKIIQELINRYVSVSFEVNKKAASLIKCQIGEDLTIDQHYILGYIQRSSECTSTELAEAFEVNKSAITAIINRLVERGIIQRTRDENDRRVVYLTLTEKGKELHHKTQEKVHLLVESFITQFDEKEITNFINTYEKLALILTNMKKAEVGE